MITARAVAFAAILTLTHALSAAADGARQFQIDAGEAVATLNEFSRQAEIQLLFDSDAVRALNTRAVSGRLKTTEALARMLEGTQLTFEFVNERTIAVMHLKDVRSLETQASQAKSEGSPASFGNNVRLAQNDQTRTNEEQVTGGNPQTTSGTEGSENPASVEGREGAGIPEILVTGSKLGTLNADIRRTANDAQPYVVFDREDIERSQASNLQEFIKRRLTMDSNAASNSQSASIVGSSSSVNLRGLGTNQTLILIDGRRTASYSLTGTPQQADLNGIPLSAVERIEVLPTTASGIYGGSATGGVINVVLRRDYSGIETKLQYGSSFQGGAAERRVDVSAGMNMEGGRTNVLIATSYSELDGLQVQDRDLVQRARSHILATAPSFYTNSPFPPLGSTTNIRSITGEDLVLKTGQPLSAPITYVPLGYAGVSTDSGAALVANAGSYNFELSDTAQSDGGRGSLLNAPTVESVTAAIRRDFTKNIRTFLELGASNNSGRFVTSNFDSTYVIPATSENNPFLQDIRVTTPALGADQVLSSTHQNRRAVVGAIFGIGKGWQLETDYTWTRTRFQYSFPGGARLDPVTFQDEVQAAILNGTLDVLRDTNAFTADFAEFMAQPASYGPARTELRNIALRTSGPVLSLSGGDAVLTMLIEYRKEKLDAAVQEFPAFDMRFLYPDKWQSTKSAYLELLLPFVSSRNAVPGIQLFELQAAVRRDDYKTVASTNIVDLSNPDASVVYVPNTRDSVDPTFGLRYGPTRDLTLRASYGTGYLPPSVHQLVPLRPAVFSAATAAALGLTDPRRGGEPLGSFSYLTGGNPNLMPEQSESLSIGAILTPRLVPGLRLSVDWTEITKDNNINVVAIVDQSDFNNEQFVPGIIVRGPVPDGDPYGVGPVIAINGQLMNISLARVEALDVALDYEVSAPPMLGGQLMFSGAATRLIHLQTQLTPTAPVIESSGVRGSATGGGLSWKANGSISWSYNDWKLGWTAHHYTSYWFNSARDLNIRQGSAKVPSQTYHDLFSSYRLTNFARNLGLLQDAEVQFGIRNVFNRRPPIDVAVTNGYSSWGDPRLASYYLAVRAAF